MLLTVLIVLVSGLFELSDGAHSEIKSKIASCKIYDFDKGESIEEYQPKGVFKQDSHKQRIEAVADLIVVIKGFRYVYRDIQKSSPINQYLQTVLQGEKDLNIKIEASLILDEILYEHWFPKKRFNMESIASVFLDKMSYTLERIAIVKEYFEFDTKVFAAHFTPFDQLFTLKLSSKAPLVLLISFDTILDEHLMDDASHLTFEVRDPRWIHPAKYTYQLHKFWALSKQQVEVGVIGKPHVFFCLYLRTDQINRTMPKRKE